KFSMQNTATRCLLLALTISVIASCTKDPYKDVISNARSIEAVTLGNGLIQVGPAVIIQDSSKVYVQVLMQPGTDLSNVSPLIQASYKAKTSPNSGEPVNFAANGNKYVYKVTSEAGSTRDWTIQLVPFTETLPGVYKITHLSLYGGTGPEYGGAAVLDLIDKPWVWPATGGPAAELDNILTFTFTGVTPAGNTYGSLTNAAGPNGLYADFQFILSPATDVNNFYRKIPKNIGSWERDYTAKTVTFKFADGNTSTGSFIGAGTINLGNGKSKTIVDNAFDFTLNGTDDWNNIYSDYDKFVKRPRRYWVEVKKQ
ncbi:MAG: hypothetical protein ABUT20_30995, partial [Bacteroidota bacterium]